MILYIIYDNYFTSFELKKYISEPTVALDGASLADVVVGGATTLVCNTGAVSGTYKWSKGDTEISGQTTEKLSLETVAFTDTANYICKVMYGATVNKESDSDPFAIFVEGTAADIDSNELLFFFCCGQTAYNSSKVCSVPLLNS